MADERKNILIAAIAGGVIGSILTSFLGFVPTIEKNVFDQPSTNSEISNSQISVNGDVSDVVEKVAPAVVSIVISKDVPIYKRSYFNPFGSGSPFSLQIPKDEEVGSEKKQIGGGSGFFVSADGYVVTNAHVVADEEATYTVFTNSDQEFEGKVIARDPSLDIALLKIESSDDLPFLAFGDSNQVKLGQTVIAIGNALAEFQNSVSVGVISGLSRSIVAGDGIGQSEQLENVIQTDAAINPGNSGGPLLNVNGEVIGVNVAVASGSENIGFSLQSNIVKPVVDSIKENGRVIRPYLGVRYVPITNNLKNQNNLSVDYGVLIARGETIDQLAVIPGSPADKAGLVENDIVLEIDGQKIDEKHSLSSSIRLKNVGDQIKLKILHKGEEKEITATLAETPETPAE